MWQRVIVALVLAGPGALLVQAATSDPRDTCPQAFPEVAAEVSNTCCDDSVCNTCTPADSPVGGLAADPSPLLVSPEPMTLILALAAVPFLVALLLKRRRPPRQHPGCIRSAQ